MLTKIRTTAVALIAAIGIAASLPTADAEAYPNSTDCKNWTYKNAWYSDGAYRAFSNGGWAWNASEGRNWSYDQWSSAARYAEGRIDRYC